MTAPSYPVYEGTTGVDPRMLTDDCEDLGGLFFQNAVGANSPDPHRHPSALDFMQMERCIQRNSCMVPLLVASVIWDGVSLYTAPFVRALNKTIIPGSGFGIFKGTTGVHHAQWDPLKLPIAMLRGEIRCKVTLSASPMVCSYSNSGENITIITSSFVAPSDAACSLTIEVY